jgi:hypothetical protein
MNVSASIREPGCGLRSGDGVSPPAVDDAGGFSVVLTLVARPTVVGQRS